MEMDFSWFEPVTEMAGDFVDWLEENPTAAKMVGGAAIGAVDYYNQKEQQAHEEKMYNRRLDDQLQNSRASTGTDDYGSHVAKLTGGTGLLTNGKFVYK